MSNTEQPFYLYLLTHKELRLHRIGIGTTGKDKGQLEKLIDQGWLLHGIWHDSDKRKTFQWEKEAFKQLQNHFSKASPELQGFVGKSDRHWFEGISADAISLPVITTLISQVISKPKKSK
jgi:hypothetical protein